MNKFSHEPVLLNEVLAAFDYLKDRKDAVFVDGTVGLAGHSLAIAKQILNPKSKTLNKSQTQNSKLKIIGVDKDEEALQIAKLRTKDYGLQTKFIFVHDDFHNIDEILEQTQIPTGSPFGRLRQVQDDPSTPSAALGASPLRASGIDGMLLDLGVSSMQLDDKERGFSFEDPDAPLDMRMNPSQITSAKDILNDYSVSELEEMLKRGEEKYFKNIAAKIARARAKKPFETVGDLVAVLKISVPKKFNGKNFATDTFRALRIEVNDELVPLARTIEDIVPHLNSGAKLAIITFHSLEDRIVKQTFKKLENPCICPPEFPFCTCGKRPTVKIISKKPILPSEEEVSDNPRARSAKLRIIEKI